MMTEKAREIGALDTQFRNASGLFVRDQYTTCYDLALIFRYALTNDKFREIAATRYFLFSEGSRNVRYKNHNRLLFCFEPTIAGKTGFTRVSRHCYVGAFEKDGKTYILSLLGSNDLWGDAVQILSNLYNKLPSDRELQLAKASSIILTSYREKKDKKPVMKKKAKKHRKNKAAYRRA
jgi:D-alanyl-D-alanine carboxypeptidase (penicillin-binding protein 5/6)